MSNLTLQDIREYTKELEEQNNVTPVDISYIYTAYLQLLQFEKESGEPPHPIIKDERGVLRWKKEEHIRYLQSKGLIDLNALPKDMNISYKKKLYKNLGMSLSGYIDVFY